MHPYTFSSPSTINSLPIYLCQWCSTSWLDRCLQLFLVNLFGSLFVSSKFLMGNGWLVEFCRRSHEKQIMVYFFRLNQHSLHSYNRNPSCCRGFGHFCTSMAVKTTSIFIHMHILGINQDNRPKTNSRKHMKAKQQENTAFGYNST